MKKHALAWLLPCLIILVPYYAEAAGADEIQALKDQINILIQKVEALEARQQQIQAAGESKADNPASVGVSTAPLSVASVTPSQSATAQATGENSGNPAISVIGTFAGSAMRGGNAVHQRNFLPMSEGEFVFGAEVDAHTRLDVTVTAANGAMAAEEAYVTSRLPEGFHLRAGRKFIPLGRANETHPHALIYADTPNGLTNLFGPDKFIGEGVFLDHPLYIGESAHNLLLGFFQNANQVAFDPTATNRFSGMGRWTGMWDLNDTATLELGSTYINGNNGIAVNSRTDILGAHLALKNLEFDHSGWSIEGEWNRSCIGTSPGLARTITDGAYLLGEYDFNRNWQSFARADFSRMTGHQSETAYTGGLAWKVSEFQRLTVQYKHTRNALTESAARLGLAAGDSADEALFRWVVAIGPHGAHKY
ncbi:MAG: hypothetical protein COS82_10820 [Zetaproteobacteria bacterium CG06_land_8_20_14_3_00_59_53]|nr:MAG: hypothetical protein AUK36_09165 [Zetaproteobacteria bacterium CG2_30_59_37]PIO90157.1 MAG: hypothetical protein COX56_04015 [Zetaproteobacteria bacterium CG23_combo_of_CG06-09_8_20_14_all_59_86]PIQ65042.1 MAG: hypothetical protein COV97_06460 [Zetaproteobacteria bacterium CG11_big_fil_rev_8_21_14_0_20_59_439]PIU69557.1 MAG: hypothetical protein COS82_10820 [Zetaproteobacteria bacterium CG06_land_8_20_14_3_00_59_53]PIU96844.1 MAG: hypothetical protein COS62_07580 [Zetaproteobacteria bac